MSKIVGIVYRSEVLDKVKICYINESVKNKVLENGGVPLILLDYNIDILKLCDAFILPGGDDFTDLDLNIINYAYKNDIPTLCICLGMQALCFYDTFIYSEEIGKLNHKSTSKYVHYINIYENTLLYKIIGKRRVLVNSRHKENVLSTKNLKISAISDDNIIEGVEYSNKKFLLGVQWHPEDIDDENNNKIFRYFIENIKK